MTGFLFLVLMQLAWSLAQAQVSRQQGGGSFAYSDSTGNRYAGTYGLKDGRMVQSTGDYPVPFADTAFPGYGYGFGYGYPGDDFYPTYFSNLENLLQDSYGPRGRAGWPINRQLPYRRAFHSNFENQQLAYNAARKAFDISSNQAGYFPNFATRLPQSPFDFSRFGGFPNIPNFEMPNYPNSAFAASAIGPGYRRQVASINPANPGSPNVNINKITHYSDTPAQGGYYSVSSKSYASSANVNGQELNRRGAETVVNDNGKVTKYKVQN